MFVISLLLVLVFNVLTPSCPSQGTMHSDSSSPEKSVRSFEELLRGT